MIRGALAGFKTSCEHRGSHAAVLCQAGAPLSWTSE
jgi:hypothetical protein